MDRLWPYVAVAVGVLFLLILVVGGGKKSATTKTSMTKEPALIAVVDYTSDDAQGADGVALVELNPHSKNFGKILQKVEIGKGVSPHHLYYNRDGSKLYTTALGGERLYHIQLNDNKISQVTPIDTGSCQVGEDLYFTEDGSKYYLTCMGSHEVVVFDAATDKIISQIRTDSSNTNAFIKYPHGIAVNESIDRMIVTSTVSPDLKDAGMNVTVIEPSTGKVLATHAMSKDGKPGSAPVELFFLPNQTVAYATLMFEGSLWMIGGWDEKTQEFGMIHLVDDFSTREQGVPLEMYIGPENKLYVSFGAPGGVNVYDIAEPIAPKLLKTLPAGAGAHHIVFHQDYMFVQNNLLNLPKLNEGTISVVNWKTGQLEATVDSLVKQGLKPASIVLLGQPDHHGAMMSSSSFQQTTKASTTASAASGPAQGFALHIDAKKHINELPETVVHHYCKNLSHDVIQCLLFDSDEPNAHNIGTETIISPAMYAKLPEEEQLYWHHHKEEIPLVDAKLPGLSEEEIKKVVAAIEDTYGKVIIFWNPGDTAPMGEPSVTEPASN
jgi:DNA-binding beta-propeller fold protein YncE